MDEDNSGAMINYLVPLNEFGDTLPSLDEMQSYSHAVESTIEEMDEGCEETYNQLFESPEARKLWQKWVFDQRIPDGYKVKYVFHV